MLSVVHWVTIAVNVHKYFKLKKIVLLFTYSPKVGLFIKKMYSEFSNEILILRSPEHNKVKFLSVCCSSYVDSRLAQNLMDRFCSSFHKTVSLLKARIRCASPFWPPATTSSEFYFDSNHVFQDISLTNRSSLINWSRSKNDIRQS